MEKFDSETSRFYHYQAQTEGVFTHIFGLRGKILLTLLECKKNILILNFKMFASA